jgi:hypothetical protein
VRKWVYVVVGSLAAFVLTILLSVYDIGSNLDYLYMAILFFIAPVVFVVGAVMVSIRMIKDK